MYLKENSFFNNFLKINFFLYLIVIAGDAASYLYQILNAKFFEVEVFGLFNKFTYSTIFFTSPIASLQLILVRYISSKKKSRRKWYKDNKYSIYIFIAVCNIIFIIIF